MAVLRSETMLARCAPHAGAERARRRWTGGPDVLSESTVSMFTGGAEPRQRSERADAGRGEPRDRPAAMRLHIDVATLRAHRRRREFTAEVSRLANATAGAVQGFASESIHGGSDSPLARETFGAACGTARGRGGRALVHPRGPESANRVFPGASQPPTSAGESATRMARA